MHARRFAIFLCQVCGLKWSFDDKQLASGSNDNKLFIWNAHSTLPVRIISSIASYPRVYVNPNPYVLLTKFVLKLLYCVERSWDSVSTPLRWKRSHGALISMVYWRRAGAWQTAAFDSGIARLPRGLVPLTRGLRWVIVRYCSWWLNCLNLLICEIWKTPYDGNDDPPNPRQVCNLMWPRNINAIMSTHDYSLNQIIVWKYLSMTKATKLTGHTMRYEKGNIVRLCDWSNLTLSLFQRFPLFFDDSHSGCCIWPCLRMGR